MMLSPLFFFVGVAVASVSENAPPSLYTCIDWECEEWISEGTTLLRYIGRTDKHLSFQKNQKIVIVSKPVDKSLPDWVGKVGNKVGLVPRNMVREDRVNKSPTKFKLDLQEILSNEEDIGTDAGQEADDELEDEQTRNEMDGVEIEDIDLESIDIEKEKIVEKVPLEEASAPESTPTPPQTATAVPLASTDNPPQTTFVPNENSQKDQVDSGQKTETVVEPSLPLETTTTTSAMLEEQQATENVSPQIIQASTTSDLTPTATYEQNVSSPEEEVGVAENNQSQYIEPEEEILDQAPFLSSAVPLDSTSTVNLQPSTDTVLQGSSTILDEYYLTETPKTVEVIEQQASAAREEDQVTPRIPETVLLDTMTSIIQNQIFSSSTEPQGQIIATRVEKSESVMSSSQEEETQFTLSQVEEKTQEPLSENTVLTVTQKSNDSSTKAGSEQPVHSVEEEQILTPKKVEPVQPHKLSSSDDKIEAISTVETESQDKNTTATTVTVEENFEASSVRLNQSAANEADIATAEPRIAIQEDPSVLENDNIPEKLPLEQDKQSDKQEDDDSQTEVEVDEEDDEEEEDDDEEEDEDDESVDSSSAFPPTKAETPLTTVIDNQESSASTPSSIELETPSKATSEQIPILKDSSDKPDSYQTNVTESGSGEPSLNESEPVKAEELAPNTPFETLEHVQPASQDLPSISEDIPTDSQESAASTPPPEEHGKEVEEQKKGEDTTTSNPSNEYVDREIEPPVQEAVVPVSEAEIYPATNATDDNIQPNLKQEIKAEEEAKGADETNISVDALALDGVSLPQATQEKVIPSVAVLEAEPVSVTDLSDNNQSEPEAEVTNVTPSHPVPIESVTMAVNETISSDVNNVSKADSVVDTGNESQADSTLAGSIPVEPSTSTTDGHSAVGEVLDEQPSPQEPQEQEEKHSNEGTTTNHHDHHHHHDRHHHRHRHSTKTPWNDSSSSSSIIIVIKHLSSTLLSFLPEPLQDTILDVDDALVFTGIIALTLVSICVPYFLIEGYMSVRPLKKKVVELNKSLWKVSAAYETQQEEFEIFKRKAIAHDEFRRRAEQSENDVVILKTLEQKHREQIHALKTQLKSQMKEAKDIRALIEKTLKDKKAVEEESQKYKTAAEKASQELVKVKEDLSNFQLHAKSTALQLGVSSKNAEVMSSKIIMLEQETENLKTQLAGECEKRKALTEEMNLVNQSKTELEKELAELKKICVQYEGTVDGLNNEIYKLDSELATIKETLGEDSPLIEIAEVQAKAEFCEKEAESLRTRLDCVCADNENLRGKLEETIGALQETRNERDSTTTKLTVLEKYWSEREEEQLKTIENLQQKFNLRDKGRDELVEMIELKDNQLRDQNETLETLKEEMEEQLAKHRNEIRTLEAKGHENWLSLCQAERKAQDARKDAEMLRQRLTALVKERERNDTHDECDDDDSDGLSGQFPMVFPAGIPHELVPPPILDLDDEEEPPPSYFGLGDFVPPPPLPDDDDELEGGGRGAVEPRRRPPPLGGTRLSPSFSDMTDEDDDEEDNNNILSPIRRREEEGCTDGSSGSGSGSPPIRGGGWVNMPGRLHGGGGNMRNLPASTTSSRTAASPMQPGANL